MGTWTCAICLKRNIGAVRRCECEAGPPVPTRAPSFHGQAGSFVALYGLNLALTGLTLGLYHFQAKVRMRQFLYGMTSFEGDRFWFDGTPRELFVGWLKIVGVFAFVVGLQLLLAFGPWLEDGSRLADGLGAVAFVALLPLAVGGSTRYRLGRTSWRGVRFAFVATAGEFWFACLGGLVATLLSFGRRFPYVHDDMRRFFVEHTRLGDQRFTYAGSGEDLAAPFWQMVAWLVPSLGLSWFWYSAWRARYSWARTSFQDATFRCTVTGEGLCKLALSNWGLMLVTFGLAKPIADLRTLRYMVANVHVVGTLDPDRVRQAGFGDGSVGEAMTDFLGGGLALEL